VNAVPAGATFFFQPGVYRGVSIAPKDGQVFLGAQGAILNGSKLLTNWRQRRNLWVIGNQTEQSNPRQHGGVSYKPGFQMAGYPNVVFFDNQPLKAVDAPSKVVPGIFYFDYAANQIYIADNPTGHTVEVTAMTDAFHGGEPTGPGGTVSNVTVQNLTIEKYASPIQHATILMGPNWTVQNNEVRWNFSAGIHAANNGKIIGNFVHDNGDFGMEGSGNNILVQGSEVAHNGFWAGVDPFWGAGGFKFALTDSLVVRGNYSHDNEAYGMWTDINNIHTLYENNVVVNNTGIGISHEISYDAVIRNNVIMNNGGDPRGWLWGGAIQLQNSQNVDVYGNKIDMTGGNGIALIQQDRPDCPSSYGPHLTINNNIHDNIIVAHDDTGVLGAAADYKAQTLSSNHFSNNQYYMSDVNNRFWWGSMYNFSNFQAASSENGTISQSYPDEQSWLTRALAPTPSAPGTGTTSPTPSDPGTGGRGRRRSVDGSRRCRGA
jgi:hypothetical protein